MTLEEALKIAKSKGYNWVAVDANLKISMYHDKPFIFGAYWDAATFAYLGVYTGSIVWAKTLREVEL